MPVEPGTWGFPEWQTSCTGALAVGGASLCRVREPLAGARGGHADVARGTSRSASGRSVIAYLTEDRNDQPT